MMRVVRGLLPKGRLRRAVALLVTGAAFGQLLVLVASPLLTRLYTPDDFGVLGVFSALLGIFGIAVSLCYELAIPLAEDDARMVNLLALSLVLALLVSSLFRCGRLAVGRAGHRVVQYGSTAATPMALAGWASRHGLQSRTDPLGDPPSEVRPNHAHANQPQRRSGHDPDWLRLSCAWAIGLLVGQIVGQSAGITTLALAFHRIEGRMWRAIRLRDMAQAAARFANLPTYGAGAALLNNAGRFAPALLVAALYGAEVAGWFALAHRILRRRCFSALP